MGQQLVSDELADEAIVWFARLKADDVSAQNRLDFIIWLQTSAEQQMAFQEILTLWDRTTVLETLDFDEFRELPTSCLSAQRSCLLPK